MVFIYTLCAVIIDVKKGYDLKARDESASSQSPSMGESVCSISSWLCRAKVWVACDEQLRLDKTAKETP